MVIEQAIPFETSRQANIARNSLSPDPVLKQSELNVDFDVENTSLICTFSGISDRVIRVSISNVIDNIKTIIECFDEFDGNKSCIWDQDEINTNG
ncbi:PCC1 [Candida oxycetoniae]|uniref:PCC1 n=1 Tax=Candida oxycetoniae TaxID=497107 RepID=A0AAI9T074_9ASCO|nr:PCC1 [Candida oxycetoniae]KAI3406448.1 PCC1 [Candida oxycetoniae]